MGWFKKEGLHTRRLRLFRKHFLSLIEDGTYPHYRQQQLYKWCEKWSVDWDEARKSVYSDALEFLKQTISSVVIDKNVTPTELEGLQRLVKRLGLEGNYLEPMERLYELVESKIKGKMLERSAYLSSDRLIEIMTEEINEYPLPDARRRSLLRFLERQHKLAKLMAGDLPVVAPSVELFKSEVCYLDIAVQFDMETMPGAGRLVVTNERILALSPHGGMTMKYNLLTSILPETDRVILVTANNGAGEQPKRGNVGLGQICVVFCDDPQYVATLISAARRFLLAKPAAPAPKDKHLPRI